MKPLPASSLLACCLSALARVKDDASQAGWTSELSRRAASALRIAGAVALGRPVSQRSSGRTPRSAMGSSTVYAGWPRRRRVLLSAATTSRTITSAAEQRARSRARSARASLESISEALGVLSYGRLRPADRRGCIGARQRAGREHAGGAPHSRRRTLWPRRTAQALRSFVRFLSATTRRPSRRAAHHVGRVGADSLERPAVRAGADARCSSSSSCWRSSCCCWCSDCCVSAGGRRWRCRPCCR